MSNKIERIAVDSSMLNAVAYVEEGQILYAEFSNTGNIYAYYEVEKEIFEELLDSDSVGGYMRSCIIGAFADLKVNRRGFKW
jgi:hypothetical protein